MSKPILQKYIITSTHFITCFSTSTSTIFAYFCTARLLPLFPRRACGLESCFAEVLSNFSRFLRARPTIAQFFVAIFWVVFPSFSFDSNVCTAPDSNLAEFRTFILQQILQIFLILQNFAYLFCNNKLWINFKKIFFPDFCRCLLNFR